MSVTVTPVEARVLAALVEKATATPEYYPLTLNALTAACNQKTNRDPVMQVDAKEVVRALDSLRDKKLAWVVAQAGSRVPKYSHNLAEALTLTPPQLAVLCELMLRGPQTVSELRTHAARMVAIQDGPAVQEVLDQMLAWAGGPLVARLPRHPGQREERYAHLLCGALPAEASASPTEPEPEPVRRTVMAENERIAALEARMTALGDELERLKAQYADFVKQFQ